MQAKGMTPEQIKATLQPIALDTHLIGNPWVNYNFYLSAMLIPNTIILLIFLVTVYSLGIEIKFRMRRENDRDNKGWLEMAHGDFGMAIFTKILPQTLVFICVFILENSVARFPQRSIGTGIWSLHLRTYTIYAYGDVRMFSLGSPEFFDGWNCIPCLRYGCTAAKHIVDVPNEALLPHIPTLHT